MDNKAEREYAPDYAVTPGEMLGYEMENRGMTQQELTRRTGASSKHINELLKAKAPISPAMAVKLERALGMPAQYWLNLEANYQVVVAKLAEEQQLEKDLDWLEKIPYNAMVKQDWLDKVKDKKARLIEVLRFFGIANVAQWDEMWPKVRIAYRQTQAHEVLPEAVSAWLRQGEIEANKIDASSFDKQVFKDALASIRDLTLKAPPVFIPALVERCAAAGVAVVFVPMLPKTGISGATRWINKDKAIIQLSLRYKSDDHLWFTFFHEAGHILLHGKKTLFLESTNGLNSEQEDKANSFASEALIPVKKLNTFLAENEVTRENIIMFAEEIGLAPGIVVGQLQHKEELPHHSCNDLKQFYKWGHE